MTDLQQYMLGGGLALIALAVIFIGIRAHEFRMRALLSDDFMAKRDHWGDQ